jgi:3-hydroxyisobutyrate/3-hydroxypropionate dehydrogenase
MFSTILPPVSSPPDPSSAHSILFVDCSTIDTATSLSIHDVVAIITTTTTSSPSLSPHRFIDAPVSGGTSGAYSASLTFMVGCHPPTLFTEIHPLLSTMSKPESIFQCGPPTSGLASKHINNYLSAICIIGSSEAFHMGHLCGLNPKTSPASSTAATDGTKTPGSRIPSKA